MRSAAFNQFVGMKTQFNPLDAPQNSYLYCNNFLLNRALGGLVRRGGTENWTLTGDIWGLGGYAKNAGTVVKTPITEYPIVHRYSIATSYFQYYKWSTSTWTTLTQGANFAAGVGISGVASFAQQDDLLCISADRCGKLTAFDGTINRLGGPAPTAKPTVAVGAGTGLTSTGAGYRWYYTFYNSTTTWESSPSPYSDFLVLDNEDADLSAMETTCAKEGVDKKRIYRTVETGEEPFFYVTEITLATTTYTDSTSDDDLGVQGPDADDHDPPPDGSYICAIYENCMWVAAGSQLWRSKSYAGSEVNLEYFSPNRVFDFPQNITGLTRFQQKLLVFMPPNFGITQIRKQSNGTFLDTEFHQSEGTNWHHSISTYDKYMTFWGAVGPRLFDQSGPVERYDEDIINYLRNSILAEYASNVFVWSVHHQETDQFLYCFSANSEGAQWKDSVGGGAVPWIDAVTGADVLFNTATGSPTVQRNLVFGIDPIRGLTGTYSWADVPDLDESAKGLSIGYVPRTKGANVSILQETLFLGTTNANLVMQTFRGDLGRDDGTAFIGKAITNRIDPMLQQRPMEMEAPSLKRFWDVEFFDVNPIFNGATVRYTRDAIQPHIDAVTWENFKGNLSGARHAFNNGLARWVHIEIEDAGELTSKPIFGGFNLRYLDFGSRERGPTDASP